MTVLDELHAAGQTIVLVTHEEYIAKHAFREVRLKDGMIESDVVLARDSNNPQPD
jgi:putative ABC transport system ATP-binding protein